VYAHAQTRASGLREDAGDGKTLAISEISEGPEPPEDLGNLGMLGTRFRVSRGFRLVSSVSQCF
jgi:hypothetical protein